MKVPAGIAAVLGVAVLAGACTSAPPPEPSGPELAQRLGCFACHSLKGQGGALSKPLDGIGARLSAGELQVMLTHPRRLRPGAKMPSYAYVPGAERHALEEFLSQLK